MPTHVNDTMGVACWHAVLLSNNTTCNDGLEIHRYTLLNLYSKARNRMATEYHLLNRNTTHTTHRYNKYSIITVVSCMLSTLKRVEQSFHTVMHECTGNEIRTMNHLFQYKWNTTSKRQQTSRGASTTLWCDLHVYKGILHARPALLLHLHQLTNIANGQRLQLPMAQTWLKQTLDLYHDSTSRQVYFKMLQ